MFCNVRDTCTSSQEERSKVKVVDEVRYVDRLSLKVKVVDEMRYVDRLSLKMTARPPPGKGRRNDLMAYPLGSRSAHSASSPRGLSQVCQNQQVNVVVQDNIGNFRTFFSGILADRVLSRATVSPRDGVFADWRGTWIKVQVLTNESQL